MKLLDRHACEGSEPAIYIGHREYPKPDGKTYVSRTWYAEWCLGARHCQKALGATNKQVAIRKAHDICRSIQAGEGVPKTYKLSNGELKDRYLAVKRNEGRAPKTLEKYEYSLQHFADWCQRSGRASAVRFGGSDFWAYNGAMMAENASEKTCYDRLVLAKQAYKFAAREKMIPEMNAISLSRNNLQLLWLQRMPRMWPPIMMVFAEDTNPGGHGWPVSRPHCVASSRIYNPFYRSARSAKPAGRSGITGAIGCLTRSPRCW